MKTSVLALLAFTALATPALAQPAPATDQGQAAPTQASPQPPKPGAMMCGAMAPGQQGQAQAGGCPCCAGMSGQPGRQGAMPMMDHSRMAQTQPGQAMDHSGHGAMAPAQPTDTPATKALREVNARMHQSMDVPFTNDFEVDFRRSMIPHHQGAIEMAKVALQYGKDPEIRKLAEAVVREQEREIAETKAWQAKRK